MSQNDQEIECEAYLNIYHHDNYQGCFYLQEKRDFIYGRESGNWKIGSLKQNDIILKSDKVSRLHAEIYREVHTGKVRWVIVDGIAGKLSTNGIFYKGHRLVSHTLVDGDKIDFPDGYCLEFRLKCEKICNPFDTQV